MLSALQLTKKILDCAARGDERRSPGIRTQACNPPTTAKQLIPFALLIPCSWSRPNPSSGLLMPHFPFFLEETDLGKRKVTRGCLLFSHSRRQSIAAHLLPSHCYDNTPGKGNLGRCILGPSLKVWDSQSSLRQLVTLCLQRRSRERWRSRLTPACGTVQSASLIDTSRRLCPR